MALSPLLVGQLMLSRFDLWPARVRRGVGRGVPARPPPARLARARARVRGEALRGRAHPARDRLDAAEAGEGRARARASRSGSSRSRRCSRRSRSLAPHGLWESLWGQVSRPIQVESLVASLLTTFGNPHDAVSHNSVAIAGYGWLAALTTAVELACLVALWIGFARGPADEDRFVRYAAGVRRGLRRVREGALAAVPDLARAARPARARAAAGSPPRGCSRWRCS